MSDFTTVRKLYDNSKVSGFVFTNISDGIGETDIVKIDPSTLSGAGVDPRVSISRVGWSISDGSVLISFEGTPNTTLLVIAGNGKMDFGDIYGDPIENQTIEPTGNILFSTVDFIPYSTYTVVLEVKKQEGF